jgi:uncharacterized hydrophobic protein (TIGR00271 family)
MLTVAIDDVARMRDSLFFEGAEERRKLSRFWVLLTLAAIIASAGIMADSTATVIGAMIVAPLMTPILGIVLAITLGDRRNLLWSLLLVVTGAIAVIAIGWLFGHLTSVDIVAATNSQVAGRVNPRLVDLAAALATGAVGAFALVRDDVGDTLPGVAIAISLVPPLAVVGLTLESGAGDESLGALLLFMTNVAAILVMGVAVMGIYRVRHIALAATTPEAPLARRRYPLLLVVALFVVVAIPLAISGRRYADSTLTTEQVTTIATDWTATAGWDVISVRLHNGEVVVRAVGPLPAPDPDAFRRMLDERGQAGTDVRVELAPEQRVSLPASAD